MVDSRGMLAGPRRALQDEPEWPGDAARRTVVLAEVASRLERRIVEAWIARRQPDAPGLALIEIPSTRRRRRRKRRGPSPAALEAALAEGDDALLAPVR